MSRHQLAIAIVQYAFIVCILFLSMSAQARSLESASGLMAYFQRTVLVLMDSRAVGDKAPWEIVLDESCVITDEEGKVLDKKAFLKELTGLPSGLTGSIDVADLTVQQLGDFAIVRFRMNEKETVFGQQLATAYRSTDTFHKGSGDWKMIASHQSVITSDPPAQDVSKESWPALVGRYQLLPNGWTFHVVLRDGQLYGGRDPNQLRRMIPMAENVFVREGTLGEWIFSLDSHGKSTKIIELRKFEPLVWTAITSGSQPQ